jgi:uroporphyrinogen decarboxylase
MFTTKKQTGRERFLNVMEYKPVDKVPNYEAGVWGQTVDVWQKQGLDISKLSWDWFTGDDYFGMDKRWFFPVNLGMIPAFEYKLLEKTDRYEIFQDGEGRIRKALIEGTVNGSRMCMDEYMHFPVETIEDLRRMKKRFTVDIGKRYPLGWNEPAQIDKYKNREIPLIFGCNCSTLGFYWRARDFMGTEGISYALYDDPMLVHEMMEFIADFTIEMSKPFLGVTDCDYVFINEDMSMKNGPLIGPAKYKEFIYPHMKRLVEFYKQNGVKYVFVDTDGNCEALLPLLMDLGVDGIWPLERVANMDPIRIRKEFGKDLRLTGAVDKMELAKGKKAIDAHLATFIPLIEEGGFIPTVDHTVPPDVSLEDFLYYFKRKEDLLWGRF